MGWTNEDKMQKGEVKEMFKRACETGKGGRKKKKKKTREA